MLDQFFSFVHVAPLFSIAALSIVYRYCKTFTRVKFNLMPIALTLSSFGIASGYFSHHSHTEALGSCYACIGYGLVVAICAMKIHFAAKEQQSIKVPA